MEPVLQVALDHMHLKRALLAAKEAVDGGADWLEAGTPLVKSAGIEVVRQLKKSFPGKTIVADLKTMDTGAFEVEIAAKAGADVITVMGVTDDATILEAVRAARRYGSKIMVDLMRVADKPARAKELEKLGGDYLNMHVSIDEQMIAPTPLQGFKAGAAATLIPLAVAGGLNSEAVGGGAKPVEAIDRAKSGDVIVIDVGGGPTAVWGELASNSCLVKGVAGVVIDGAVRDLDTILELNFPCFSRHVAPHAGEPKGLGEIGSEIECGGQKVHSGDWIVGDESGLIVVAGEEAAEMANRALDVLEREKPIRAEIKTGGAARGRANPQTRVRPTRAPRPVYQRLRKTLDGKRVTYHERAAIVSIGSPPKAKRGPVLVVTAGTSDIPVAEEAGVTAELMGCKVTRLYDVGVAGVHRVLDQRDLLRGAKVIVVVAGMEGALPSVVAGLVHGPPAGGSTSVGYGAGFYGVGAPLGVMNSCAPRGAPGEIDKCFGARHLPSP